MTTDGHWIHENVSVFVWAIYQFANAYTVMIKRVSGKPNVEWYPKKASTVFNNGGLVNADGSGAVQPADATSGDHIGLILKDVAATDDDYASTTKVPVDVLGPNDVCEADVGTGTLTTAMVGNRYDLKDDNEIDVSATSKQVVTVVGFVSASKALIKVNSMIGHANVATT